MTSIGKASVKAVKWSALTTLGRFALQLIAQSVLARILGPENYGLFGIGMVVYTFGNFFSSFGFGRNLLQKPEISQQDIRFAFTWQLITGGLATVIIYLAAGLIAEYFQEPRALPVIQWLSLACLLNAATAPANNLLQRDLNFRITGLIQVISYAIGYLGFAIPLALNGFGVAALVTAWLVQAAVTFIASYWAQPHPVKPLFWFADAKHAFGYGGTVFFTNIINWLLNNLDRVVIGRLLNTQAFGLYSAGYNLATMPNTLLLGTLQTTFLASGAKVQHDKQRLADSFLQVLASIWVLLLPVFVFLALVSEDLVAILYGPKWKETASVLAILFLGMPAFIAWGLSTPILWNTGRGKYESLLQIPVLILGAAALVMYAGDGINTAALVTSSILAGRALVMTHAAMRAVGLAYRRLLPSILRGLLLSIVVIGPGLLGKQLPVGYAYPWISLAVSSVAAIGLLVLIIRFLPQLLGQQTMQMLIRFMPSLGHSSPFGSKLPVAAHD
ncbi:MAG: polysaccharide biosynthesis protein [Methylomonas sp.]|nr:MAG: polysaccharide biosynthesis protein [Methylomonas sp.]